MNLNESLLTALDSLRSNKLRAALTMLGVIIGVAAVIALLSIGNGVSASINDQINAIGTNLILISTDPDNSDGYPALTLSDVDALSDPLRAPDVADVAASVGGSFAVTAGGNSSRSSISGVTANYFRVNNIDDIAAGDVLTENDIDTQARVAVLGWQVAEDLFPDSYAVGQSVKINGASYEVVGVLAQSGSAFGGNDTTVFVPISTAQSRLVTNRTRSGQKAVDSIIAQAASNERNEAALEQIAAVLREEHRIAYADEDDFQLLSQSDLLDTAGQITGVLTAFLGAVAGISLLVGGIGIMNIMLVSVTERTREIGIRKAVGALRRDILLQFLLESVVLSLIGGIAGILLGWAIAAVAGRAIDLSVTLQLGTVLLATGFATAVGLVFGIYPAWRAARLRPIEALRYE
ncbi:MAG: ABC transporter permease [Candidatus Promineofilum sp.]|nr:ABC transporter permease [Promineifilum sp.]MCW5863367.1 ABC transporter permease [Anaerolineae bacterium]